MGAENANGFLVLLLLCGTGWEAAGATQGLLQPMPVGQVICWFPFETGTLGQELCLEDLQCESCSLALCFGCMHCISVVILILRKIAFPFSKCDYLFRKEGSASFLWRSLRENKLEGFFRCGVVFFVWFFLSFLPLKAIAFCLSYYKCSFWLLLQRYFETSISSQPVWEEFINIL